jgi:hypothetical protein
MVPLKNRTLKQYNLGVFQHILTSQFVYRLCEECTRLQRLRLKISTQKQKKIHYMYLWLLTKKTPSVRKFYPSWKNTSSNILVKAKTKKYCLQVTMLPKDKFALLHELLMQMISKQTNSEKPIWTFHQHNIQVMVFAAPLTTNTALLGMNNMYFPTIPVVFQFRFSKTTAFQKLFFLRGLKLLSPTSKLGGLDSFF